MAKVLKVGILGAGISGLAAAKELARYDPVVFEATDSIGGVWRHCSFRTTKLQTPRMDYEFSDFPWEDRSQSFPTHAEILEYLHGYATHFDLWRHIRLNSKVVELRFLGGREASADLWCSGGEPLSGQPMWEVGVCTGQSTTVEVKPPSVHPSIHPSIDPFQTPPPRRSIYPPATALSNLRLPPGSGTGSSFW